MLVLLVLDGLKRKNFKIENISTPKRSIRFKTDTNGFVSDIGIGIEGAARIRIEGNREGKNCI